MQLSAEIGEPGDKPEYFAGVCAVDAGDEFDVLRAGQIGMHRAGEADRVGYAPVAENVARVRARCPRYHA